MRQREIFAAFFVPDAVCFPVESADFAEKAEGWSR